MAKYRKKPVVVEAFRFITDKRVELAEWCSGTLVNELPYSIIIPTLEGNMSAFVGDWIIKGVQGEFYPCKADIFTATYDFVEL